MMTPNDTWKLVSFGNISSRCEFCEQPPVEYALIAMMDGHVRTIPVFLCANHRETVILNIIFHNRLSIDDLTKLG